MTDCDYMRIALRLAEHGGIHVSPNPKVGALLVRDNLIIGSAWHKAYGQAHAERNALAACSVSPEGATMYVTLEPCCHYGKTPPCTEAIIAAGIARVVIGSLDPNPAVCGQGVAQLRRAGIEVVTGVLQAQCEAINAVFFHYIRSGTPYVLMKYAMTMDGKIATATGESQWISSALSRQHVHVLRHRHRAIMVGIGTVLADDPQLSCRLPQGRSPIRVICDTHLRCPVQAQVIQTAKQQETILATACTDKAAHEPYRTAGCEILPLPTKDGHVDLHALMQALGARGIDSLLLEGGAQLNWSALAAGVVQRVQCYIAPKLFGGAQAKSPIGGSGVASIALAPRLCNTSLRQIGTDFLLEGDVMAACSPAL